VRNGEIAGRTGARSAHDDDLVTRALPLFANETECVSRERPRLALVRYDNDAHLIVAFGFVRQPGRSPANPGVEFTS
jgi:hypothetical protein